MKLVSRVAGLYCIADDFLQKNTNRYCPKGSFSFKSLSDNPNGDNHYRISHVSWCEKIRVNPYNRVLKVTPVREKVRWDGTMDLNWR